MGGIDLDPTSSEKANEAVKATTIHTTEETIPHQNDPRHKEVRERNLNATLAKPWNASTVWMNPPYNAIECAALTRRLVQAHRDGDIAKAIVLVSDSTDTEWWQRMAAGCSSFGFARKRIELVNGDTGDGNGGAARGSTLFLFGIEPDEAKQAYGDLLHTMRKGGE